LRIGLNKDRGENNYAEDDASFTRESHSQPPNFWADIYADNFSIDFSGVAFQHKARLRVNLSSCEPAVAATRNQA
jgi:hypothetical protein